jgi:hypothetical protein
MAKKTAKKASAKKTVKPVRPPAERLSADALQTFARQSLIGPGRASR